MTTIAYKDGVMAADTRAYRGNKSWIGTKTKIFKIGNDLVGVSTSGVGVSNVIIDWYTKGMSYDISEKVSGDNYIELLVVKPDGSAMFMDSNLLPTYINSEYYAVGSGDTYAMGAMAMGASPKKAVKVAKMFDPFTDCKIETLCAG